MLNYEVEPALLRPRVPAGLELDFWRGRTFLSLVGFRFLGTRLRGWPILGHQNFAEVNLRYYVVRQTPDGPRRGVVFLKEIVPRRAVALVARWCYNENYVTRRMRSHVALPGQLETGRVGYHWHDVGRWNHLEARFSGLPTALEPDSEPRFIAEHYWGYGSRRDGATLEYHVAHPPWRVWGAEDVVCDCDVARIYGLEFAGVVRGAPSSAFVADGSEVVVHGGSLISPSPSRAQMRNLTVKSAS